MGGITIPCCTPTIIQQCCRPQQGYDKAPSATDVPRRLAEITVQTGCPLCRAQLCGIQSTQSIMLSRFSSINHSSSDDALNDTGKEVRRSHFQNPRGWICGISIGMPSHLVMFCTCRCGLQSNVVWINRRSREKPILTCAPWPPSTSQTSVQL